MDKIGDKELALRRLNMPGLGMAFADLKNDFVFRRIFATRPHLLRGLLNDLLERQGDETLEPAPDRSWAMEPRSTVTFPASSLQPPAYSAPPGRSLASLRWRRQPDRFMRKAFLKAAPLGQSTQGETPKRLYW